jgi:hypothetical protein
MLRLQCKECGTSFAAEDQATIDKLKADHNARYHENKAEQIRLMAVAAKSMAFGFVNGAVPSRKKARDLVSLASRVLNEPIPDMPEEMATVPAVEETGAGGEQAKVSLPAGTTSPESRTEAAKAGAELNKKNKVK